MRRGQQAHLERLPGDLAAERRVEAALDLGARRRRIDEERREHDEQRREREHRAAEVGQAFHCGRA